MNGGTQLREILGHPKTEIVNKGGSELGCQLGNPTQKSGISNLGPEIRPELVKFRNL